MFCLSSKLTKFSAQLFEINDRDESQVWFNVTPSRLASANQTFAAIMPSGNYSADSLFLLLTSATGGVNMVAAYVSSLPEFSGTTATHLPSFGDKFTAVADSAVRDGAEWRSPYHPVVQVVGWIVASLLSLETIIGNAMVIVAYKIERSISKQVSNQFIVSLAVSDLIIGIEGIPLFTVYVINGDRWPLGKIACETWLFLDYTLCLVSILTVLLITADRYLSVCHTAEYLKWQNPLKIQMLILLSWVFPAAIFGVMIYGWPIFSTDSSTSKNIVIHSHSQQAFETASVSNSNGECFAPFLSNPYVNMSMYVAYYWTTLIAMLILYKGIHKAAKKLEKKAKAKEHRHIALLLTQRLGTQVGVSLMLQSKKREDELAMMKSETKDSGYNTNTLSTNGISSYPANGGTSEVLNMESRRSSAIFIQPQLYIHSSQELQEECSNFENIECTSSKENHQEPLRRRSATIADGLNNTGNKNSWIIKRLSSFSRFRSWSHSACEVVRQQLPPSLLNEENQQNHLRQNTLPDLCRSKKMSSDSLSIQEIDVNEDTDDENTSNQGKEKIGYKSNKIKMRREATEKTSLPLKITKDMLMIGPPNTPDFDFKHYMPFDYDLSSTVSNNVDCNATFQVPEKSCCADNSLKAFDNYLMEKLLYNKSAQLSRTTSVRCNKEFNRMYQLNNVPHKLQKKLSLCENRMKSNQMCAFSDLQKLHNDHCLNKDSQNCIIAQIPAMLSATATKSQQKNVVDDGTLISNNGIMQKTATKTTVESINTSVMNNFDDETTNSFFADIQKNENNDDETSNDLGMIEKIKNCKIEETLLEKELKNRRQRLFNQRQQFRQQNSVIVETFEESSSPTAKIFNTSAAAATESTSVGILRSFPSNSINSSTSISYPLKASIVRTVDSSKSTYGAATQNSWIHSMSKRVTNWVSQSVDHHQIERANNRRRRSSSTTSSSSSNSVTNTERHHPTVCLTMSDNRDGCRAPKSSMFQKRSFGDSDVQKSPNESTVSAMSAENGNQAPTENNGQVMPSNYLGVGLSNNEFGFKISSLTKNTGNRLIQSVFAPISAFNRIRKRTKAEKRAHKAFRTITFIVGLFAILWSPYYVVATIYGFCKGECVPSILYNLSYYMCYLNSSGNPFAYALANRQFRSAFLRMFHGDFNRIA